MKSIIHVFIALILSVCSAAGCSKPAESTSAEDYANAFRNAVDIDYAYDLAYTLAYDDTYLTDELGFRTAGSEAEHAAADFIASEMEKIGLHDVEKTPVSVDAWEYGSAIIEIDGIEPMTGASYASVGTEGITAEITDAGNGKADDYKEIDANGKIVLAAVDQWNDTWINVIMDEAALHGAAAILTYASDGYSMVSDDAINMQDICADGEIPCISISRNQAVQIREQLQLGNTAATLRCGNTVSEDGTAYNVSGRIPGRSSDEQIILSAHYDVYFNGFQDDSCAVALIMSMAKAMIDSGYKPESDILIVAHAAEEWGASGSEFDWAIGSYEMANSVHPEWAQKTKAVFNFELPAYEDQALQAIIRSVPEYSDFITYYVKESGLAAKPQGDIYPDGIQEESNPVGTYDDNISYRVSGIPTITNLHNYGNGWYLDNYHTVYDSAETFNEDVFRFNAETYGTLAILMDQMPAMPLNFAATAESLDESFDYELMESIGIDSSDVQKKIAGLKEAGETYYKNVDSLNHSWLENPVSTDREEGKAFNNISREVFSIVQDEFVWTYLAVDLAAKHEIVQENIACLTVITDALKDGDAETALSAAGDINAGLESFYFSFSPEIGLESLAYYNSPDLKFWGTGKLPQFADTGTATQALISGKTSVDFKEEIAVYEKALQEQVELYRSYISEECEAMEAITALLNA